MPDELPSLHIDNDWKKQAQEEKKRLAEEQSKAAATSASAAASPTTAAAASPATPASAPQPGAPRGHGARAQRELPPVSFGTLVQSLVTQVLFYLGDLAQQGGEPVVNLDMAKHQIDTLTMLEEKTRNNLTPEETQLLDAALYETRMRYVNVAAQFT